MTFSGLKTFIFLIPDFWNLVQTNINNKRKLYLKLLYTSKLLNPNNYVSEVIDRSTN